MIELIIFVIKTEPLNFRFKLLIKWSMAKQYYLTSRFAKWAHDVVRNVPEYTGEW